MFIEPPRKKNFLYENVKSLRKMEKDNAKETDKDDADKLGAKTGPRQSNKYQHVAPRVYSSGRGSSAISTNSSVKNNINCSRISLSGKLSAPSLVKTADKKSCISLNSHPHFNSADKRDNKLKTKERYKSQCNLNTSLLNLDINCETDSAEKKKSRSLGIQTLDTNDLDSLYSEGIIRYVIIIII